jgi:hypothetical protein
MAEAVSTRPLLDKLGVRPGARVALARADPRGATDAADPFVELRGMLRARTDDVNDLRPGDPAPPASDLVFLEADSIDDLLRIGALRGALVPNGAIWVVSRKGRGATLRDGDVIAAARSVDLVDNKVVAFSPIHTALRLVIPVALRPR